MALHISFYGMPVLGEGAEFICALIPSRLRLKSDTSDGIYACRRVQKELGIEKGANGVAVQYKCQVKWPA